MAELTDEEFEAANERGRELFETVPHARAVRFDRASGRVIVELFNDCTFTFPARQLQGLERASDDQLAQVELLGVGYGLHWEDLDADFTVPGLMAGRFGNAAYMAPFREQMRAILTGWENEHHEAAE